VNLAVGLFFGPACAGYEEELGVGADGLGSLLRSAEAGDGGARGGEFDGDLLDVGRRRLAGKGFVGAWVEEQEPGARFAGEDGFDALAIEPAGCFDVAVRAAEGGDVGVDEAAEAMGHAGGMTREKRALPGARTMVAWLRGEGFAGGGVAGITRLGEGLAGDGQEATCGRQGIGQVLCAQRRRCRW
jgi:hypothetical protein